MGSEASTGVAGSNKICNSMLTGLSYVTKHIVDNLLFCSLDHSYSLSIGSWGRQIERIQHFWGREEIILVETPGSRRYTLTTAKDL